MAGYWSRYRLRHYILDSPVSFTMEDGAHQNSGLAEEIWVEHYHMLYPRALCGPCHLERHFIRGSAEIGQENECGSDIGRGKLGIWSNDCYSVVVSVLLVLGEGNDKSVAYLDVMRWWHTDGKQII